MFWSFLGLTSPKTHFEKDTLNIKLHPFYVSVIQIDHNEKMKTGEVSIRIFTEDFESTLRKFGNTKVDLTKTTEKEKNDKLITDYILHNLQINIDGKPVSLHFVGYEQQLESIWSYFEISNIGSLKSVSVNCSLLYDYQDKQINIFHIKANGIEKSTKLDYPQTKATISLN